MCGLLLSQLIGQTVANRGCMVSHVELLSSAEQQLCSRVRLEELPEAVVVPQSTDRTKLALSRQA